MSRCQLTQVQLLSTLFTHTLSESLLVSKLLSEYLVPSNKQLFPI